MGWWSQILGFGSNTMHRLLSCYWGDHFCSGTCKTDRTGTDAHNHNMRTPKWKSEKPRLLVMRKLGSINRSPGKGFPPGTIMIMPTTAPDDDDGSWWWWRWRWQWLWWWWLEVQLIPVAILSTLNSSRPGLLLQTYVALCPLMTLVMMILVLKLKEVLLQSLLFFIQAPTWDPF